jgi:hypothetical protein
MKLQYKVLHLISKVSMYTLIFTILFLVQKYTIGIFFNLRKIILFNKFYLYEFLFVFTSVLIIKLFIKIGSPYEKYLSK